MAYHEKKLHQKVKDIIDKKDFDSIAKSNNIMKALREDNIRITIEYVNSFLYTEESLKALAYSLLSLEPINISKDALKKNIDNILSELLYCNEATIDPDKIVDDDYKGDTAKIHGNSFGPYKPEEYFKENQFRILWILKESYIKKGSWIEGARGEVDQAEEYVEWHNQYGKMDNPTHDKIISLSRIILQEVLKKNKDDLSDEEVMNHLCIIEVNHFPGLAFNSTNSNDSLIRKWVEYNNSLIETLIDFYNPNMVIGGTSFFGYFTSYAAYFNFINKEGVKKFENGEDWSYEEGKPNKIFTWQMERPWEGNKNHYMVRTTDGRYLIAAYHPSARQFETLSDNLENFAKIYSKEN